MDSRDENLSVRHQKPGDARRPRDTLDRDTSTKAEAAGKRENTKKAPPDDPNFGRNGE